MEAAKVGAEAAEVEPVAGRLPRNHQYAGKEFPRELLPPRIDYMVVSKSALTTVADRSCWCCPGRTAARSGCSTASTRGRPARTRASGGSIVATCGRLAGSFAEFRAGLRPLEGDAGASASPA